MKNDLKKWTKIVTAALVAFVAFFLLSPSAQADGIIGLGNINGSGYIDFSSIQNGSSLLTTVLNGSPSAGSINVNNNVAGGFTTLILYYDGSTGPANDAGSNLTCHNFSLGGNTSTCSIFDPNDGLSYSNGTATPSNLPDGTYTFTWTFPTAVTGNFNISWASLSGSGYNACISSSPSCTPTSAPEPSSFMLLGAGLFGLVCLLGLRKAQPVQLV